MRQFDISVPWKIYYFGSTNFISYKKLEISVTSMDFFYFIYFSIVSELYNLHFSVRYFFLLNFVVRVNRFLLFSKYNVCKSINETFE